MTAGESSHSEGWTRRRIAHAQGEMPNLLSPHWSVLRCSGGTPAKRDCTIAIPFLFCSSIIRLALILITKELIGFDTVVYAPISLCKETYGLADCVHGHRWG